MGLCTAVVVLSGVAFVVGKVIGIPVRPGFRTVAEAPLPAPAVQQDAPPLPLDSLRPPAAADTASAPRVQNVILFIGDGMGLSMLSTTDALAARRLAMTQMPVTGLVRTASLTGLITDSGAGATAMATGYKTHNGGIGMTPDGQRRTSIFEAARRQGFATGVVTTSYLTDATPAGFIAHTRSRGDQGAIACQMLASGTDVLLGGWAAVFSDSLQRAARRHGFVVSDSLGRLAAAPDSARLLGLFLEHDGRFDAMHGQPLEEPFAVALRRLRQRGERFFLVAEQEGIDEAGHTNRLGDMQRYVLALDRAVARALRFAARDGRTLVLVTADHDTGGLSVTRGDYDEGALQARWAVFGHTAQWVPLLAYGPGAQRFTGVQENTALPAKLARLLRLDGFLEPAGEP